MAHRIPYFDLMTFEFLADQLPFGYAYNFENYLFNKIQHINMQGIGQLADYFLVNHARKRVEAKVHFLVHENVAYSPYKSLFGSYEFSPRIHVNLLSDFVRFTVAELVNKGVSKINLIHHAQCYAPEKAPKIQEALINNNFNTALRAINHHIPVTQNPLASSIHVMERRRLLKCRKLGLQFSMDTALDFEAIYDFIEKCRAERGLEVSISKSQLANYLQQFPQNYWLMGVRLGNEILAATVAIKVSRKIVYNFLPASLLEFNDLSPMVMLLEGLYGYLQQNNYELLDLGISTLPDGTQQESLIQFKERMGGVAGWKYFYEMDS